MVMQIMYCIDTNYIAVDVGKAANEEVKVVCAKNETETLGLIC